MTWIALRYRGGEYSARDLIDIANRFLEDTGYDFVKYEIYDDCDLLMITGQNAAPLRAAQRGPRIAAFLRKCSAAPHRGPRAI